MYKYQVEKRLYIEPISESWKKFLEVLEQFPEDVYLECSPVDYSL